MGYVTKYAIDENDRLDPSLETAKSGRSGLRFFESRIRNIFPRRVVNGSVEKSNQILSIWDQFQALIAGDAKRAPGERVPVPAAGVGPSARRRRGDAHPLVHMQAHSLQSNSTNKHANLAYNLV